MASVFSPTLLLRSLDCLLSASQRFPPNLWRFRFTTSTLLLLPSAAGCRHPAEVRGMNVTEKTWVHAELLQLKQGKVRNEMTDGAQLGLLWKHEGSSKHVMVLLHRVVLEEL